MGFKSTVKGWAASTWSFIRSKFKREDVFDAINRLATEAVEYTLKIDLNGDGHAASALEVLQVAAIEGVAWGKRFEGETVATLVARFDKSELLRWVAIARVTSGLIARYGGAKAVPLTRVISFAVEKAYLLLTAPAVEADFNAKGFYQ